jgi:hypothetical protein
MPKLTAIAVSQQTDGTLEIVASAPAEGAGRAMWHSWQVKNGPEFHPWEPFGIPGNGQPGRPVMCARVTDGYLEVFTVTLGDGEVCHRRQTGSDPVTWSDWEILGLAVDRAPFEGPVAVTTQNDASLIVTAISDGSVYQDVLALDTAADWSLWSALGQPAGWTVKGVAAQTARGGFTEVVALFEQSVDGVEEDNLLLRHCWRYPGSADGWSAWQSIGGEDQPFVPAGVPVLAQNFAGFVVAFSRSADGAIWYTAQQGESPLSWGAWQKLVQPGYDFADLAVGMDASDGTLLLAATTATGNHLWYSKQRTANDDDWSPLSPLATVPEASAVDEGALASPVLMANADRAPDLYVVAATTGNLVRLTAAAPGDLPTSAVSIPHP